MPGRTVFIETTTRGEPIFVTKPRHRGSDSMSRGNEERLYAEIVALRRSVSIAESNEYRFRTQYQTLANEHSHCRNLRAQIHALENEVDTVQARYENEQENVQRLQERIRLMRRTSHDAYKQKYAEKAEEVEALRRQLRDKDSWIASAERRLDERDRKLLLKSRTISNMKAYLSRRGIIWED